MLGKSFYKTCRTTEYTKKEEEGFIFSEIIYKKISAILSRSTADMASQVSVTKTYVVV